MKLPDEGESAQDLQSPAVIWWATRAIPGFPVIGGDVLATREWGGAYVWRKIDADWKETGEINAGFAMISAWWSAGLIAPATVEDGDRFLVHRLFDEMEDDGPDASPGWCR